MKNQQALRSDQPDHRPDLKRVEVLLRGSESSFRALVESAPDGIVITDRLGLILLVNAQTEALFGYRREEMLGQAVEMLVPWKLRAEHTTHRSGYTEAPRVRAMGEGQELFGRRQDGSEFPVSISLSPIPIGSDLLIFADVRDISAQREAEHRIRELNNLLARQNAELQAVNQELEAFSYSVSHDLRAPLRAIDGFSRILLKENGEQLDAQGRDRLERVRRASQHMGSLIDDLLKLARVTRAGLQIESVDLSALAAEIAEGLQKQEPGRAAQIEVMPGLHAQGDAKLLRIALDNLFSNAWKFTGQRQPASIAFGQEQDQANGSPAYYLRDNGAGFDMTYADKLFGAFQRLHDSTEFPGTGIGLATVQRIVHKHGGRIWAQAAVDQGATFWFTLAEPGPI